MEPNHRLIQKFVSDHKDQALQVLDRLSVKDLKELLKSLPPETSSLIISLIDRDKSAVVMQSMDEDELVVLMNHINDEIAQFLLRSLNTAIRDSVISKLPEERGAHLKLNLSYPKQTVGAIMAVIPLTFSFHLDIDAAISRLRKFPQYPFDKVPVVDNQQVLKGFLGLAQLVAEEGSRKLNTLKLQDIKALEPHVLTDSLLDISNWNGQILMPVTTANGVLQGLVSYDQVTEANIEKSAMRNQAMVTTSALADLYKIGLEGLLKSAGDLGSDIKSN